MHVFFDNLLKYCHDLGTKASKNLVTATLRLKKNQSENLQLVRSCVHASQNGKDAKGLKLFSSLNKIFSQILMR